MAQGHNLAFIAFSGNLKTVRKLLFTHHPRMVATHNDTLGQTKKYEVYTNLSTFGVNSKKNGRQIFQFRAKHFPYCLMT